MEPEGSLLQISYMPCSQESATAPLSQTNPVGGEYEDGCLLGCSALMMEASRTSETLVNFYQTTRRYNPEDSHLQTNPVHTHPISSRACLILSTHLCLGIPSGLFSSGYQIKILYTLIILDLIILIIFGKEYKLRSSSFCSFPRLLLLHPS
jgi:hypothetical protein